MISELTRAEKKHCRKLLEQAITQKTKEFFEAEKAKIFSIAVDLSASENEYDYYLFLKRMEKELPNKIAGDETVMQKVLAVRPNDSLNLIAEDLLAAVKNEFNILYGWQMAELTKKFAAKEIFDALGYPGLPEDFYLFDKSKAKAERTDSNGYPITESVTYANLY
jgi:hypothetical protein